MQIDNKAMRLLLLLFVITWISAIHSFANNYSGDGKAALVSVGLVNHDCGEFEVRVKPYIDLTGLTVTNIQFTIRWPENTVELINFTSTFNVVQQGPVYVSGGFNYAIFVSATPLSINWSAGNEYTLLSFSHDQSGTGYADFNIADDAWTVSKNGLYYFEVLGLDETGSIYQQADNTWLEACGIIDAGIFNTGCDDFEVRLKPHDNYPDNVLTNLQFTISWPENTVNLVNFTSTLNVQQQGPTYTVSGTNYAIFISATPLPVNWTSEEEYTVLTFNHDQSWTGIADFTISSDAWTQGNNGTYYTELLGLDKTGILYHQAENISVGACQDIDIGIFNTGCGDFEIRAKPQVDFMGTSATNIQFTVTWPENTVGLINFLSTFNIVQQGPVYTDGGFNYAIFVSVTPLPINWTAEEEYILLSFSHDQSGTGYTDFNIADDAWTLANNGLYYFEVLGLDETGTIYHQSDNTWVGSCGKIDAGIFSTGCGDFEVRLKPHDDFPDDVVTNLQFTISWPENTVNLINFISAYGVQQQGPVYTDNGTNYAIFVSAIPIPVSWIDETEYTVLSFSHDQSGTGYADFLLSSDAWTQTNNGTYYIELLGLDKSGMFYHQAENIYIGACSEVDIGIFYTDCAEFEIRLKPHDGILASAITNIKFTIKWPANSVDLINFASAFGITQQGPTVIDNNTAYAVFESTSTYPINWTAEIEYTVLTFSHDQTGLGYADFSIDISDWSVTNNSLYYFELLGLDFTGTVYHNAQDAYIGECGIVDIKVILQGGYLAESEFMNTAINLAGNLPAYHPYDAAPWNYAGTESMLAFPDSIVDWVLVELRDKTAESVVVETRAGLLSKSGIVLDTSLKRGLHFSLLSSLDTFYLVVKHRNHMAVMSGDAIALPNLGAPYDFTEIVLTQPYKHLDPLPTILELNPPGSGKYGMIAGDINADGVLKYIGSTNDRALILQVILNETGLPYLNTIVSGYFNEDITLDNQVKYLGALNDRAIILSNLVKLTGLPYLNTIYNSVVP